MNALQPPAPVPILAHGTSDIAVPVPEQPPAPTTTTPHPAAFYTMPARNPAEPQIVPATVTTGFIVRDSKLSLPNITQQVQTQQPVVMALTTDPPFTIGYAPTETTPSLGESYFAPAGITVGDPATWYLYPTLPVLPATGGAIKFVDSSGQHILESIAGNLYYDTELLAKAGDIQDVADWALYPAIGDVDVNGKALNTIGAMTLQAKSGGGDGIIDNIQVLSGDAGALTMDIVANGAAQLQFKTDTTMRALMTPGGTFQFLTAAPQTAIVPINADDLTNKTYVDGLISTVTMEITDVSGRVAALTTRVADISAGLFDVSARVFVLEGEVADLSSGLSDVSGRVYLLEQEILEVSGNIANWSTFPAVSDVTMSGNKIQGVSEINSSLGANTTITADQNLFETATNVFVTADGGFLGSGRVNITSQNGLSPQINLAAKTSTVGIPAGVVNITADGGSVDSVAYGGLINLEANSGPGLFSATSAIKATAAGINLYAGAIPSIGSLAGYLFEYGTLGINMCVTLPSVIPNVPGSLYMYAPNGIVADDTFYTSTIYPRSSGVSTPDLVIRGRTTPSADVILQDIKSMTMTSPGTISNVNIINGSAYVPTQEWSTLPALSTVSLFEPPSLINPLGTHHDLTGANAITCVGLTTQTINGTTYVPTQQWSTRTAVSDVNMGGYSIRNVLDISASAVIAGTTLSATNALTVGQLNYPEVNYAATLAVDVNATGQIVFQNKNTGPNASAAIFVIEGTATDYMGVQVNSANYSQVDNTLFELPSAGIISHTVDVVIGAGSDHSANARTYLTYSDGQAAYCLNEDGALSFDATYTGGVLNTGNFGTTGQLLVSQGSTAHPIYTSTPTVTDITVTGAAKFSTGTQLQGNTSQVLTLLEQGTTGLGQLRASAINFSETTTDTDTVFFKRTDGYIGVLQPSLATTRVAYLSDVMQQIAASFSSNATQTVTAANTPTRLTYTNTEYTKGGITYDVSGHIIVPTDGAYEFIISIQFDKTGGGVDVAEFWFQIDDVDVPRSATQLVVAGTNGETVGTVSVFLSLTAGQKVSTMIASPDSTMGATAFPAITTPYVRPAVPSIITTVKMITDPDGTPVTAPTPSPGPITVSPGPALPTISMTQHVLTVPASTANIAATTVTLGPVADGVYSIAGFSMSQNGTITQSGVSIPKVVTWSDGTDWFLSASLSNCVSSAAESWKVNVQRVPATISATTNLITL